MSTLDVDRSWFLERQYGERTRRIRLERQKNGSPQRPTMCPATRRLKARKPRLPVSCDRTSAIALRAPLDERESQHRAPNGTESAPAMLKRWRSSRLLATPTILAAASSRPRSLGHGSTTISVSTAASNIVDPKSVWRASPSPDNCCPHDERWITACR